MEKLRLLLVDDSQEVLEELSSILETINGIQIVAKAINEGEAIRFFHIHQPHLVCLDIRLQLGSGINILKRIKMDKPSTIVFMITNYPYNGYRKKCLQLGANFFFDKSKDIPRIKQILEELTSCGRSHFFPE